MKKIIFLSIIVVILFFCSFYFSEKYNEKYERKIDGVTEFSQPNAQAFYFAKVEERPGVSSLVKVGKWVSEPNVKYYSDVEDGEKNWMSVQGLRLWTGEFVIEYLEIHEQKIKSS